MINTANASAPCSRLRNRHILGFDCCHRVAREGRLWFLRINLSQPTNMPGIINPILPLDMVAHIIQVALTPVFLLSGIATLLNVFSTRLARVADRVDQITKGLEDTDAGEVALLAVQLCICAGALLHLMLRFFSPLLAGQLLAHRF
jgi:hypothetical protein